MRLCHVKLSMQAAIADSWAEHRQVVRTGYPRPSASVAGRKAMHERPSKAGPDPSALIRAIADRGDRTAFAALFELYAGRIKAWLMRTGASGELAEDIAQETLLTIWRKARSYDPARANASAWIFAIARNARIDRFRRERRAEQRPDIYELMEPEEAERPDSILDAAEREQQVQSAIAQLSGEQLTVIRLSFFEGRPHAEIAERLDLPLGTVKSRLRLAMKHLRTLLGDLS